MAVSSSRSKKRKENAADHMSRLLYDNAEWKLFPSIVYLALIKDF